MQDMNDLIKEFERQFVTHMLWEFPQIDEHTRKHLASELAIIAASEVEFK